MLQRHTLRANILNTNTSFTRPFVVLGSVLLKWKFTAQRPLDALNLLGLQRLILLNTPIVANDCRHTLRPLCLRHFWSDILRGYLRRRCKGLVKRRIDERQYERLMMKLGPA